MLDVLGRFANKTFPESQPGELQYHEFAIGGTITLIICVLSVVGNAVVLSAVMMCKKLRTPTNAFVSNLAAADIMTGLGLPFSVIALLNPDDDLPVYLEIPCEISGGLLFLGSMVSMMSIEAIAVNRAVLVKYPLGTYMWFYSRRNLAVMITVIWLICFSVAVIPTFFGNGAFGYNAVSHTCSTARRRPKTRELVIVQCILMFHVPFVVIIASMITFMHLHRHFKSDSGISTCDDISDIESLSVPTNSTTGLHQLTGKLRSLRRRSVDTLRRSSDKTLQYNITMNLFITVFAFHVCVMPAITASIVARHNQRLLFFLTLLFLVNCCINPFIYAAKHPYFKHIMRDMVLGRYFRSGRIGNSRMIHHHKSPTAKPNRIRQS